MGMVYSSRVAALEGVSQPGVVVPAGKTVGRIRAVAGEHGAARHALFFGVLVEQVLGADGDVQVFGEVVTKVEVGDPLGAVDPVEAAVGGDVDLFVRAVTGQGQVEVEAVDAPVTAQDQLGLGLHIGDQAAGLTVHQVIGGAKDVGGRLVVEYLGLVPVERRRPLQRAVRADVLVVVADQVHAFGAGVGAVDEVLAAVGGVDAVVLQDLGHFRAEQGAGQGDAVTQVDHVGVGGEVKAVGGREGETEAEVGRALGFQAFGAQGLGDRQTTG